MWFRRGSSSPGLQGSQPGRIPIPMARRLRLLRMRVLPLILFLTLVTIIINLWREHVLPVPLLGEAIANRAEIIAPRAGLVVQLYVQPFASVYHGDQLAVVMTTDPTLLEARLAVIRAEVDLMLQSLDPLVGRRRADLDYERLRVELMSRRAAKAEAEVRQLHAKNHLHRARKLNTEELISIAELEQVEADHNALTAEVAGHSGIVASLKAELERLEMPHSEESENTMLAAIRVHEERLRLVEAELAPVTLRAPMDGQVGMIHRGTGEHVVAGEPLMTVMAETSDRVLAYLRQPIRVEPYIGQAVEISAPSRDRGTGIGRILHMAAQLEPLPEVMLPTGRRSEKALPLVISLPPGIEVKPGEQLTLSLLP